VRPLALVGLLVLAGCETSETTCRSSRSCIDRNGDYGLCARNRCAFFDDSCPTQYRWDDSAGDLAAMCVHVSDLPDAAP
jgi:hypothetical protein